MSRINKGDTVLRKNYSGTYKVLDTFEKCALIGRDGTEELAFLRELKPVPGRNDRPLSYTLDQAAEKMNCSRSTINRCIKNGELESFKFAGRRLVPHWAIDRIVNAERENDPFPNDTQYWRVYDQNGYLVDTYDDREEAIERLKHDVNLGYMRITSKKISWKPGGVIVNQEGAQ